MERKCRTSGPAVVGPPRFKIKGQLTLCLQNLKHLGDRGGERLLSNHTGQDPMKDGGGRSAILPSGHTLALCTSGAALVKGREFRQDCVCAQKGHYMIIWV